VAPVFLLLNVSWEMIIVFCSLFRKRKQGMWFAGKCCRHFPRVIASKLPKFWFMKARLELTSPVICGDPFSFISWNTSHFLMLACRTFESSWSLCGLQFLAYNLNCYFFHCNKYENSSLGNYHFHSAGDTMFINFAVRWKFVRIILYKTLCCKMCIHSEFFWLTQHADRF